MASVNFTSRFFILLASIYFPYAKCIDFNYPAVFNFGDSNSDTGELAASGLEGIANSLPCGQTYFQTPTGRYCDGRLIVDFLMDAMDLPYLNPYLDSVGAPIFRRGCNFATAGSTVLPATASSISPFSYGVQVAQFLLFKARVQELAKSRKFDKYIPSADFFGQALYMFDIGQNDLAGAFYSKSLDQVLASIPYILQEFETGIKKLYDQGARFFWVHNTGPIGCLTQNIAKFGNDPSKLDAIGCVSAHNKAAQLFNLQLHALCKKLHTQFTDNSTVTYVDIYTIKSNLISTYSRFGFEEPIMACCGSGGPPLNYDSRVPCGQTKVINGSTLSAKACSDNTEYVSWDGIHYTESANQYVSSQILTGKYSDPPFSDKMPFLLKLKF